MNAEVAYSRERRRRVAEGTWEPRVPTGPVQAHIDMLLAAGMFMTLIADAAGVSTGTIRGVRSRSRVQAATARAILSVRPSAPPTPAGFVRSFGATRRLQALAAIGWELKAQAKLLGCDHRQVWDIAHGRYPLVKQATWERIAALFERLSATPGGSPVARRTAASNGWAPPLAWDDIDRADAVPDRGAQGDTEPDPVVIERALAGERLPLTTADREAALLRGIAQGMSLSRTALTLGINYSTAQRYVSRQHELAS